jgi:hypothetical protein
MSANPEIHLVDIPIRGSAGREWNRLHTEREDVCEALLKDRAAVLDESGDIDGTVGDLTYLHRGLLESRLKEIDDSLDQLMVRGH